MRIASSNIGMEAARYYSAYADRKSSAYVTVGTKGLPEKQKNSADSPQNGMSGDTLQQFQKESTFEDQKNEFRSRLNGMSSYSEVQQLSYLQGSRDSLGMFRDRCMQYLMEIFFGEKRDWNFEEIIAKADAAKRAADTPVQETVYTHQETFFEEREETSFSAAGAVKTADGRTISFQMNVEMSRSFSMYYEENYAYIRERMRDPLVINLEGDAAELSDQTFYFDIDADGRQEEISMLGAGSGYLALDRNGDGVINDGSELFGAKSGNGFADLSAYDADGNGWIDENDEIWKKLLIWTKDETGKDKCYSLSQKGVGAICLSNADTEFSLNSKENVPNGRIRKTGIFLYENGFAGTIQHLDVAAHDNYV